jgi:hypothetical protein
MIVDYSHRLETLFRKGQECRGQVSTKPRVVFLVAIVVLTAIAVIALFLLVPRLVSSFHEQEIMQPEFRIHKFYRFIEAEGESQPLIYGSDGNEFTVFWIFGNKIRWSREILENFEEDPQYEPSFNILDFDVSAIDISASAIGEESVICGSSALNANQIFLIVNYDQDRKDQEIHWLKDEEAKRIRCPSLVYSTWKSSYLVWVSMDANNSSFVKFMEIDEELMEELGSENVLPKSKVEVLNIALEEGIITSIEVFPSDRKGEANIFFTYEKGISTTAKDDDKVIIYKGIFDFSDKTVESIRKIRTNLEMPNELLGSGFSVLGFSDNKWVLCYSKRVSGEKSKTFRVCCDNSKWIGPQEMFETSEGEDASLTISPYLSFDNKTEQVWVIWIYTSDENTYEIQFTVMKCPDYSFFIVSLATGFLCLISFIMIVKRKKFRKREILLLMIIIWFIIWFAITSLGDPSSVSTLFGNPLFRSISNLITFISSILYLIDRELPKKDSQSKDQHDHSNHQKNC